MSSDTFASWLSIRCCRSAVASVPRRLKTSRSLMTAAGNGLRSSGTLAWTSIKALHECLHPLLDDMLRQQRARTAAARSRSPAAASHIARVRWICSPSFRRVTGSSESRNFANRVVDHLFELIANPVARIRNGPRRP